MRNLPKPNLKKVMEAKISLINKKLPSEYRVKWADSNHKWHADLYNQRGTLKRLATCDTKRDLITVLRAIFEIVTLEGLQ